MSDAQVDGGDTGGNIQDGVAGQIGADDNAAAVRWYGLACIIMGYAVIPAYWFLDDYQFVSLNAGWFHTVQLMFLPAGMGWLMVSMFDGAFMRAVFRDLVAISVLAPFFVEWYNIALYFVAGEGSYDNIKFLLWGAFFIAHTLLQGVVQIILVPGIMDWTHQTDYLDNDQEKNLLSFGF